MGLLVGGAFFFLGGGGLRGRAFCGQFWFFWGCDHVLCLRKWAWRGGDGFPMKYTNIQISNTHYDNLKKIFSGRQYQLVSLC